MERWGSLLQCPEQAGACTGVGAVGCVLPGRSHHPLKTLNWSWRVSWSKILSPIRTPSYIDGGEVCQTGGGGGDDGGGDAWGPWEGDCEAYGAGLEEHSGSAEGLPQKLEGPGS